MKLGLTGTTLRAQHGIEQALAEQAALAQAIADAEAAAKADANANANANAGPALRAQRVSRS